MVDGKVVHPRIQQPRGDDDIFHTVDIRIQPFDGSINALSRAIGKNGKEEADPNLCASLKTPLRVNLVDLLVEAHPVYHRCVSM